MLAPGHTSCAGCGMMIGIRKFLNFVDELWGKDVVIVNATGCLEVTTTYYNSCSWEVPYVHSLFENAASIATGLYRALKDKGTKVICIGGDGATYDIGFQFISGMLERKENVLYLCYDNGAYMNTGIQRSSATPLGAKTTTTPYGKRIWKKNILRIMAAHDVYVASISFAYPNDMKEKVKKALEQPSFLLLDAPCPTGWKFPENKTFEVAKLAVETGFFPLVEYEPEKGWKITYEPKFLPIEEYFKLQGRFKGISQEEIEEYKKMIKRQFEIFKRNLI
jgi:pyruvate ferredoxin oxidoreductase beta subunit